MQITKDTLADQVYEILKAEILEETIPGGSKITLKQLQDKFNISTTPLREAMNRLTQEGLLMHTTNVGAHVILLTRKDVAELYQMSIILESAALEAAFHNSPEALKKEVEASISLQESALLQKDLSSFLKYSDQFHDLFFHFADNERLYEASKRYRNQISILVHRYQTDLSIAEAIFKEHAAIAAELSQGCLEEGKTLFCNHLKQGGTAMLLKLEG